MRRKNDVLTANFLTFNVKKEQARAVRCATSDLLHTGNGKRNGNGIGRKT
jgi:hypothetical protein